MTGIPEVLKQVSVSCADMAIRREEEFSFPGTIDGTLIRLVTRLGVASVIKVLPATDIAGPLHELQAMSVLRKVPNVVQVRSFVLRAVQPSDGSLRADLIKQLLTPNPKR